MEQVFNAILSGTDGACLTVCFPDFPGCVSSGPTVAEALAAGREALQFHVDAMLADGDEVPRSPSPAALAEFLAIGQAHGEKPRVEQVTVQICENLTPRKLRSLFDARCTGVMPEARGRLEESARIPIRQPAGKIFAEKAILFASILAKPRAGDVVLVRLLSGEDLVGIYAELEAPEVAPKRRQMRRAGEFAEAPPTIALKSLDWGTVSKFKRAEIAGIWPIVEAKPDRVEKLPATRPPAARRKQPTAKTTTGKTRRMRRGKESTK